MRRPILIFLALMLLLSCVSAAVQKEVVSSSEVVVNGEVSSDTSGITASMITGSDSYATGAGAGAYGSASGAISGSSDANTNAVGSSESTILENKGVIIQKSTTKAVSETSAQDGSSSVSNEISLGSSAGDASTFVTVSSSSAKNGKDVAHDTDVNIIHKKGNKAVEPIQLSTVHDDTTPLQLSTAWAIQSTSTASTSARDGGTALATAKNEVIVTQEGTGNDASVFQGSNAGALAAGTDSIASADSRNAGILIQEGTENVAFIFQDSNANAIAGDTDSTASADSGNSGTLTQDGTGNAISTLQASNANAIASTDSIAMADSKNAEILTQEGTGNIARTLQLSSYPGANAGAYGADSAATADSGNDETLTQARNWKCGLYISGFRYRCICCGR